MKKRAGPTAAAKRLTWAYQHDSSTDLLAHLHAECIRTGYELSSAQRIIFEDLSQGAAEWAIARLHAWWCYDLEKLLQEPHPKPRIFLSVWLNRRGTLIVSWRPTQSVSITLENSDFRADPCILHHNGDRLIEIREFRYATVFHRPPVPGSRATIADLSDNRVIASALLVQTATALVNELKKRLAFCFTITMIEDVYVEWGGVPGDKWDFRACIKYWEIKNVAGYEKEKAMNLLGEFQKTFGCSLADFATVVFGPDEKALSGPAPLAHTKIERSVRRFKALGHNKLTRSVVKRYVDLLKAYRADLLPASERPPSNVVPFNSKK